jgi:uncharacterized protein YodC (DUF2158 family)
MNNHPEFKIISENFAHSETIQLKEGKEVIEKFSVDGSVLMRWHEKEARTGLVEVRHLHYSTAVMAGYTGVRNLEPKTAWELFNYKNNFEYGGVVIEDFIDKNSPTLLLPLQGGICPYDCKGCPFAAHAEGHEGKKTKELSPKEIRLLIEESLKEAKKASPLLEGKKFGVAFVGSGDATPNPHLKDILEMVCKDFSNTISRVRISTVAGKVNKDRKTPMQVVADIYNSPDYNGEPVISVQVSAQSTNEEKRALHVYDQRPDKPGETEEHKGNRMEKLLLPLNEIAKQFQQIVDVQINKGYKTVRKPTLTFVCNNETEIRPEVFKQKGFGPENTVIQLRPLLTEVPEERMQEVEFNRIYTSLREEGFDVVIMPVSPSEVELKA